MCTTCTMTTLLTISNIDTFASHIWFFVFFMYIFHTKESFFRRKVLLLTCYNTKLYLSTYFTKYMYNFGQVVHVQLAQKHSVLHLNQTNILTFTACQCKFCLILTVFKNILPFETFQSNNTVFVSTYFDIRPPFAADHFF